MTHQFNVNQEFFYQGFDAWIMQVQSEGAIVVYDHSSKMTYLSNEELSQWIGVVDSAVAVAVANDPGIPYPPINTDQAREVGGDLDQAREVGEVTEGFERFDLFHDFKWGE